MNGGFLYKPPTLLYEHNNSSTNITLKRKEIIAGKYIQS